jgi:NAD(P)-dependent dehydrogenase (short-subunit alcohol dehydrogenase family)
VSGPHTVRDYPDQTAVIVGGTSGIGLACAHGLAAAGVRRIALLGRNSERGENARAEVTARCAGAEVLFVPADAGDGAAVESALRLVHERLGGPDVVIASTAADRRPELLHRMSMEEVSGTLVEMTLPPLLVTRAALPYLTARGGGVVLTVASDAGKVPTPGESALGAAMAAIMMFSRVAAIEGKRAGIRVNVLTPSLVLGTETARKILADGFSKKLFEKAAEQAHLGVVEADEVAALAVWLAGPAAAKITGQAISVNGGISAA